MKGFTHLNSDGSLNMVDVSDKKITTRRAVAQSEVIMQKDTLSRIKKNQVAKGNVFETAKIAGIMAAKKTSELIPLCHPIKITNIDMEIKITSENLVKITASIGAVDQTGAEMEALTASSVAALTIYDMCKAYDKGMTITNTLLISKSGGKSGEFKRCLKK